MLLSLLLIMFENFLNVKKKKKTSPLILPYNMQSTYDKWKAIQKSLYTISLKLCKHNRKNAKTNLPKYRSFRMAKLVFSSFSLFPKYLVIKLYYFCSKKKNLCYYKCREIPSVSRIQRAARTRATSSVSK